MLSMTNRARWIVTASAIAVAALTVAACNVKQELLAPQNPGLIDPSAVDERGGRLRAQGRRDRQALDRRQLRRKLRVPLGRDGNLTDEYHNADFQNTRQDIDQRSMGDDNPSESVHERHAEPRLRARRDHRRVAATSRTAPPTSARCTWSLGFLEMSLGGELLQRHSAGSHRVTAS